MPTYNLKNNETEEIESHYFTSWKDRDTFLKENPHYETTLATPGFLTERMSTLRKAGTEWQNVLTSIKKASGRNNTIRD